MSNVSCNHSARSSIQLCLFHAYLMTARDLGMNHSRFYELPGNVTQDQPMLHLMTTTKKLNWRDISHFGQTLNNKLVDILLCCISRLYD